jgi:hypothetical protein
VKISKGWFLTQIISILNDLKRRVYETTPKVIAVIATSVNVARKK